MIRDSFGRTLDYLRVSVTDRCNLRCVYCMPREGVQWKPHEAMLSFEEMLRICRVMAELGIRRIKITGGEPLVRRGIAGFLKNLKAIAGIEKVTLTTNGILLEAFLDEAEALGVTPDGVNISLDALDSGRYGRITQMEGTNPLDILKHIDRLLEKKIPVKINCVPVRGNNEDEILPLAALARGKNISVRFIELMPLGAAAALEPIPGNEVASILEKKYGSLAFSSGVEGFGPALYYSLEGFAGKIGFINAVSHGFCERCNRMRLSSEGFLKLCLSSDLGVDLKTMLRSGAEDSELSGAIVKAAGEKPAFHNLSKVYGAGPAGIQHPGGMYKIGG